MTVVCRHCEHGPAIAVTLRRQRGLGVIRRVEVVDDHVCHDCGLALARAVAVHNLSWGWWGIPAVFQNVAVLVANRRAATALRALPPPEKAVRRGKLEAGFPIPLRPRFLLTGIVALAVVLAIVLPGPDRSGVAAEGEVTVDQLTAGMCFDLPTGTRFHSLPRVPCNEPHDAQITAVDQTQKIQALLSKSFGNHDPRSVDEMVAEGCHEHADKFLSADENSKLRLGWFNTTVDGADLGTTICYLAAPRGTKLSNPLNDD